MIWHDMIWYDMMTLKHPPPLCSFKSHKYESYDNALYIVFSYYQSHKADLKAILTCSLQVKQRVFFWCNLSSTYPVNFTNNMSRSGWTWRNIWNLLTINFKYKYLHNTVNWSGLYLQVYIPSWLTNVSRFIWLPFLDYWKKHLWNPSTLGMIWLLIWSGRAAPKVCPPSAMKSF